MQQHREIAVWPINNIDVIKITAYEPAFGIIGDPAKRDPKNATICRPLDGLHRRNDVAEKQRNSPLSVGSRTFLTQSNDEVWKRLMLTPYDFDLDAITKRERTRSIMETIFL